MDRQPPDIVYFSSFHSDSLFYSDMKPGGHAGPGSTWNFAYTPRQGTMPVPRDMDIFQGELDQANAQLFVSHLLSYSPYVYYDYFLTFSKEVEFFWDRGLEQNLSFFTYFFLFNRYASLIGDLPIFIFGMVGPMYGFVRIVVRGFDSNLITLTRAHATPVVRYKQASSTRNRE
ncbi:hypothetical protein BC834DRAFT_260069 [Gloeopeniophorella convolvens]|nr:hypothetical protein BC834DRAFT_260069 [Gloeopeniophorella convolvens]